MNKYAKYDVVKYIIMFLIATVIGFVFTRATAQKVYVSPAEKYAALRADVDFDTLIANLIAKHNLPAVPDGTDNKLNKKMLRWIPAGDTYVTDFADIVGYATRSRTYMH